MLEKYIPKKGYSNNYGSSALKALQNDELPLLDLFIREAIQNSSDAALDRQTNVSSGQSLNESANQNFRVNFNEGSFSPTSFHALFDEYEKNVFDKFFPQEKAHFLEVRDCKTSGLTGPLRPSELDKIDHGNYFKLKL